MSQNLAELESKKVDFLRSLHDRESALKDDLFRTEELVTVEAIRVLFLELFGKAK